MNRMADGISTTSNGTEGGLGSLVVKLVKEPEKSLQEIRYQAELLAEYILIGIDVKFNLIYMEQF